MDSSIEEVCLERIVLVGDLAKDSIINDVAHQLADTVVHSENGFDYLGDSMFSRTYDETYRETYFVVQEFTGPIYNELKSRIQYERFLKIIYFYIISLISYIL